MSINTKRKNFTPKKKTEDIPANIADIWESNKCKTTSTEIMGGYGKEAKWRYRVWRASPE